MKYNLIFIWCLMFTVFTGDANCQSYDSEDLLIRRVIHNMRHAESSEIVASIGKDLFPVVCSHEPDDCIEMLANEDFDKMHISVFEAIQSQITSACNTDDYLIENIKLTDTETKGELEHRTLRVDIVACDKRITFQLYSSQYQDRFYIIEPPESTLRIMGQ